MKVLGLVENMSGPVCPHCGNEIDIFGKGGAEKLAKKVGIDFLGSLPFLPSIVKGADSGVPGVEVDKGFADLFAGIAEKVVKKVEE